MSNVVSIHCTCDYLVKRAARHRRAGRYDEAMALLWKAWNLYGVDEEAQLEMARIYDEIGCEEDAARTYLRIVRLNGKHKAQALFHLSLFSVQRGDISRASSYFERFQQIRAHHEIPMEMAMLLERQLQKESGDRKFRSKKARARFLEKHSAASLQAGRVIAAQRAMEHALKLRPRAQSYTMLACCQIIRADFDGAVASAKMAHAISPGNVQALCVLSDAYAASGSQSHSKKALALAALCAQEVDDLLCVAVESAKTGDDALTLRMTQRILRKAPFHTRAMMIRACALVNTKAEKTAERLLGRLCGLLPEDSISEAYYKRLRDGRAFSERLSLGIDVTHDEGVERTAELLSAMYIDPKEIDQDEHLSTRIVRLCDWALYSPMAGASTKTVSLVILASLSSERAKGALLDALMNPQLADSLKLSILQMLTGRHGFYPYDVDIGGKLVRLAAGSVIKQPIRAGEANSKIVQRAADALSARYPDAPQSLLSAFLAYLDAYEQPDNRHEDACAAALECWYYLQKELPVDPAVVARRNGVSVRLMRMYLRRFESCMQKNEQPQQGD